VHFIQGISEQLGKVFRIRWSVVGEAVMCSLPHCKEQRSHTDFFVGSKKWTGTSQVAASALVALQDDSKFVYYPFGEGETKKRTVSLMKGDMLLFRGDLKHSGAAYKEENFRLHWYMNTQRHQWVPNTTYFPV